MFYFQITAARILQCLPFSTIPRVTNTRSIKRCGEVQMFNATIKENNVPERHTVWQTAHARAN